MRRSLAIIAGAALVLAACAEPQRRDQPGAELVRTCAGGGQYWRDDQGPFLVTAAGLREDPVSLAVTLDEVCPAPYL